MAWTPDVDERQAERRASEADARSLPRKTGGRSRNALYDMMAHLKAHPELSKNAVLVGVMLANALWWDAARGAFSQTLKVETICRDSRIKSDRTVRTALGELREARIVRWTRMPFRAKNGEVRGGVNRYDMLPFKSTGAAHPAASVRPETVPATAAQSGTDYRAIPPFFPTTTYTGAGAPSSDNGSADAPPPSSIDEGARENGRTDDGREEDGPGRRATSSMPSQGETARTNGTPTPPVPPPPPSPAVGSRALADQVRAIISQEAAGTFWPFLAARNGSFESALASHSVDDVLAVARLVKRRLSNGRLKDARIPWAFGAGFSALLADARAETKSTSQAERLDFNEIHRRTVEADAKREKDEADRIAVMSRDELIAEGEHLREQAEAQKREFGEGPWLRNLTRKAAQLEALARRRSAAA